MNPTITTKVCTTIVALLLMSISAHSQNFRLGGNPDLIPPAQGLLSNSNFFGATQTADVLLGTGGLSRIFIGGTAFANPGFIGIGTTSPPFHLTIDDDGGILALGTANSGVVLPAGLFDSRMIWYPRKASFRAGFTSGAQWNDGNTGFASAAFGQNNTASGVNSTSTGQDNISSGEQSFSSGVGNQAIGQNSFAIGETTTASGQRSFTMGMNCIAGNDNSFSGGIDVQTTQKTTFGYGENIISNNDFTVSFGKAISNNGFCSQAFGLHLNTPLTTSNSYVFGTGFDTGNRLTNGIPFSFMIGFNSTVPTFFVEPPVAPGLLAVGEVGIATTTPGNTLEINSPATSPIPGASGLRFTDLNSTSTTIANPGTGVLSVDASGDVIYVPSGGAGVATADNGLSIDPLDPANVQLGNNVGLTTAQLLNNREIPMNENNIFLTDPAVIATNNNRVQLGTFATAFPLVHSKFVSSNNLPTVLPTGPARKIIGITGATTVQLPVVLPLVSNPLYINNIANTMRIGVLAVAAETPATTTSAQFSIGTSSFGGGGASVQGAYGTLSKALSNNPSGNSFGVLSVATGQGNLTGVFGNAGSGTVGPGTRIGIRGSATGGTTNFAGFFDGDVFINSPTFGGFIVAPSDQQFKTNVNVITNAQGIINQLQPKEFYFDGASFPQIHFSGDKQYGFVAQDVELILPELVTNQVFPAQYDSLGNQISPDVNYKALNYNAFIAILMKGAQEQQVVIDSLLDKVTTLTNCVEGAQLCNENARLINNEDEGTAVELENLNAIILDQNTPNPFKEKSTITYTVPDEVDNAHILFYDMNGRIIKDVTIDERGEGKLIVYGENLKNGIYTYSLIADGELISTKRMVKSK